MYNKNSAKIRKSLCRIITLSLLLAGVSTAYASRAELDEINYSIQSHASHWLAGETTVSQLSPEERKMRLGSIKPVMTQSEVLSFSNRVSSPTTAVALPATLDWRNFNGNNYVTPVKDQGNCSDCWAFATTAALESNVFIAEGIGSLDLAEQIQLSCSGAGNCNGGYIDMASNYIVSTGLPSESYNPYTATNGQCPSTTSGWLNATSHISSWNWVTLTSPTVDALKSALNTYGPLVSTMEVYTDFYYYSGGVYQYTSGSDQGGHAILIVGYDDAGQYFIVKNSWGSGWGESGYFKIAYSQLTSVVNFGDYTISYFTSSEAPGITVSSPKRGETWQPGTAQTITWSYTGNPGANVEIDLLNNGSFAGIIASSVSIGNGGSGSYSWNVPSNQATGNLYQIRVTSITNTTYTDTSDSSFSITSPSPPSSITVISPNGGEAWQTGTVRTIMWSYTGNPGANVKVDLLYGGSLVGTIASAVSIGSAGSGSYNWKVPSTQTTGSLYQIRVTSTANTTYTDRSNTSFTITSPPPSQYLLTTVANPSGSGTVSPGCSGGCLYNNGTTVSLTPAQNSGYIFSSWTGCDNPSGNFCNMTMSTSKNVTANYTACSSLPVKTGGTYYSTLQEAYNATLTTGATMKSQSIILSENPDFNLNVSFTLKGGYNCTYSANNLYTIIKGTMTISKGAVTIDGVLIF